MKVITIFGTRPEAIKMCPLILELRKHKEIDCITCLTGQHREMLRQVMDSFGIVAEYNLDIMTDGQTLTSITTSILKKLEPLFKAEKPDLVLVHGDTTTAYASALAAFYQKIPVGHVEAGLRTGNIYSPFPEEMNRLLIDKISTFYFAPTDLNQNNLIREGIDKNIYVTGNTVIDAFAYTVKNNYIFSNNSINSINFNDGKVILVTAHRRENLGEPIKNICRAIKRLAEEHQSVKFVYPVHMNPAVREPVFEILGKISNVYLTDPIDVLDMHNLIPKCIMVMTDSGGLQEEAPAFGKPVLVMRTETERPEAVAAGTVKVVGVEEQEIFDEATKLLRDNEAYTKMAMAVNPYGDGHASERIANVIREICK